MKKKFFSLLLSFLMIAAILPAGSLIAYASMNYETENNNDYNSANPIYNGNTINGKISDYNDVDYYKFTVSQNGYIQLNFSHSAIRDNGKWNIIVYKQANSIEEIDARDVFVKNLSSSFPKIGVTKGTYYIKISEPRYESYVNDIEYGITVNFTSTNNWESETNKDYENADTIALGQKHGGYIRNYNDLDYYKFTVSQSGYIQLNFTNTIIKDNAKWSVAIYKHANSIEEIDNFDFSAKYSSTYSPKIGVTKGTYYIAISEPRYESYVNDIEYGITVNFTSTNNWESETNNTYTEADTIVLGQKYGGYIRDYNDLDYFKFTVSQSGYIKLIFTNTITSNSNAKWDINFYKLTNTLQEIKQENAAGKNSYTPLEKIWVAPGTYYIKISEPRYESYVNDIEYGIKVNYFTDLNTLVKENGVWYYVEEGEKVNVTTLVKYNGTWYYVKNGKVDFNATTLCNYDGVWYYVQNGKANFKANTLCKYGNTWYYIQNGKVNWNATTLFKYGNTWYYVQNGKVNFNATTLCKYGGAWYYVKNGIADLKSTTLCNYSGTWYYVQNGKVNFNATTLCKYGNTWYYVEKGKVNFKATTLCKYGNTWYYVQNGRVNFNANLRFKYYGKYYNVRNGVVKF